MKEFKEMKDAAQNAMVVILATHSECLQQSRKQELGTENSVGKVQFGHNFILTPLQEK